MARDYAKQRNPNAGNRGSRGTGRGGAAANRRGGGDAGAAGIPGWVWMLMGLAIGLAVAAVVYIGRPSNKVTLGSGPATATAAKDERDDRSAATKDDDRKAIKLPPKQPSRFAFYEMLPSYEVVIPRESGKAAGSATQAAKPAAAPEPPDVKQALAEPGQYVIQVGAYRSREEADKHRASLALIGIESRIEQVTIDQKDTWYRVRIGPQATLAKAQEVLDRLADNDIKAMLIKVKS